MQKKRITIPVFIPHLGCPHRCAFCNQWSSSGTVKPPDRDSIIRKIKMYMAGINPTLVHVEIAFFGGSFTGIKEKMQEEYLSAAYGFLEKGLVKGIRISTRPDYISLKSIKLLKKYGVNTIELGVQSFSNIVLERSGRGHTAENSIEAHKILKENGMGTVIQLMPGLPGDSREISIESALKASLLEPDAARIYPAVVLKDTDLENLYREGSYTPLSLDNAADICSEMLKVFNRSKIPVIRIGLHPFSEADATSIVSGPYHPAFGFIVKSRLKRDEMEESISRFMGNCPGAYRIILSIPPDSPEEYIGLKKENIRYLEKIFNLVNLDYKISRDKGSRLSVFSLT